MLRRPLESAHRDRPGQQNAAVGPGAATLRNTSISLLRIAGVTNIAAALRHSARKNRRVLKRLGLRPA